MSISKPSAGVLAILTAFRNSEDCNGNPSQPLIPGNHWPPKHKNYKIVRQMVASELLAILPTIDLRPCIHLTDSGLALFRATFPDHPYSRDWLASEREATSRRESLLNLVLHAIPGESHSPHTAAEKFARDHFEGHHRIVDFLHGDYLPGGEWAGIVELMEDDDYRASTYRMRFDREAGRWEFRAPLD